MTYLSAGWIYITADDFVVGWFCVNLLLRTTDDDEDELVPNWAAIPNFCLFAIEIEDTMFDKKNFTIVTAYCDIVYFFDSMSLIFLTLSWGCFDNVTGLMLFEMY